MYDLTVYLSILAWHVGILSLRILIFSPCSWISLSTSYTHDHANFFFKSCTSWAISSTCSMLLILLRSSSSSFTMGLIDDSSSSIIALAAVSSVLTFCRSSLTCWRSVALKKNYKHLTYFRLKDHSKYYLYVTTL